MSRISVVLIGCGYWGSKLKKYIETNKNFNLKYVCDSKSNLSEAWEDNDVDAVVIATPNNTHHKLTKQALMSGKHVMVEKPLALTTKECIYLQSLASEKRKTLLTEYTYTFSRGLKKAVGIVKNGWLGDLVAVDMSVKHLGRFGGGSVYWLLGSHMLSVLDMLYPIKDLDFKRKDIFVNEGEVESGIISFGGAISGQISLSLNYPWKEPYVVFYCKNGTIKYVPEEKISLISVKYARRIWTINIPKKVDTYEFDEKNNLRFAVSEFYDCIKGHKKDNITRAVEITRILEDLAKEGISK